MWLEARTHAFQLCTSFSSAAELIDGVCAPFSRPVSGSLTRARGHLCGRRAGRHVDAEAAVPGALRAPRNGALHTPLAPHTAMHADALRAQAAKWSVSSVSGAASLLSALSSTARERYRLLVCRGELGRADGRFRSLAGPLQAALDNAVVADLVARLQQCESEFACLLLRATKVMWMPAAGEAPRDAEAALVDWRNACGASAVSRCAASHSGSHTRPLILWFLGWPLRP